MAAGLAGGALALIDPVKLRPGVRTGLCLGTGAASGFVLWTGTAPAAEFGLGRGTRGALAVGMAATGTAAMRLGFVVDARIHRALVRRGVAHPRAVIAVGSGILTMLTFLLEPRAEQEGRGWFGGALDEERTEIALTDPVRELVAGMLAATADFGSAVIREQLRSATERHWGDPQEPGFRFQPDFAVAEAAPLTVPRDFTFPVHAYFTTGDGRQLRMSLLVRDGQLASLMLEVDPAAAAAAEERGQSIDDDPFPAMDSWPVPADVRYVLDG
ncbi:hypothetical protein [Paeniglutamicibacter cryotolerans]|uniref:Uncharacterized protein n=1 Tax=Paeniglutamicibacter cryotolerans TaxID=670079 RepID=A0A839QI77_9MICC|nr:hypothetical protein [Paeniglutamicibacter cryotolerans]MBB2994225.1 hypothetical protein [Paeniglutamicibacter cryotolerans]